MEARDDLADALEQRDWTVIDTFGGLEGSPSVVVRVSDVTIDDETFDHADLTVTVTQHGLSADRLSVSDEDLDLSDSQRDLLDEASTETLSGPEITVWEYVPGTRDDDVDEVLDAVHDVYADAVEGGGQST